MLNAVDATRLKKWLHDGAEIALLDVREHGQYGESHLFYATPLAYSRLELQIASLVPRRSTRIVVYDDGVLGVAERAAHRLVSLGYPNTHVLMQGTRGWAAAGFELFAGVNVPSKTFGELVEHHYHTPSIGATELARRLSAGEDIAVIDVRPLGEYLKMTIPGSRCCPNGELAYRIANMVPDPATTIVLNCAGRTRSIIGAQTLINFGIPNQVYALENGTQGWYLSDFELEHGSRRQYPESTKGADLGALAMRAQKLARRHGVREVSGETVNEWLRDVTRTTYVFDVRTPEEFAAGSLEGVVHAPGGQLLQEADLRIAVRNARVVVFDGEGIRAPVVASWLKQMGHDAFVLEDGLAAPLRGASPVPVRLPELAPVSPEQAQRLTSTGCKTLDLRSSMDYRKGHIPGSIWTIRPRLPVSGFGEEATILVTDDPGVARVVAHDLALAGARECFALEGGFGAWKAGKLPIESTPDAPSDVDCIDYLFFVHDRHDGNKKAARQYLAWETALVTQLDQRERQSFRLGLMAS